MRCLCFVLFAFSLWSPQSGEAQERPMLQLDELPTPSRVALLRAIDADIAEAALDLDQPLLVGTRRRYIAGFAMLAGVAAVGAVGFYELAHQIEGPEDGPSRSERGRRTAIAVALVGPTLLITALALLIRGHRMQNAAEAPAIERYQALRLRRREIQRVTATP